MEIINYVQCLCFTQVYKGYVDDPRNTDNAWMETVAVNFHDETGESVGKFNLHAGMHKLLTDLSLLTC